MNKQNLLLAYVTFSCFIRIVICPCPIRKMLGFTANQVSEDWKKAESVYDFSVKNIKGQDVSMEMYKGFVLIIVNVASKCNYASQHYKELVELDSKYREKGLRILAFPCNQFGKQEPGDADSICSFADKQKVKFEVFEKVDVNGNDAHPLFKYLKFKQDGLLVNGIKWNYTKFIVDRKGQPVERHAVNVSPLNKNYGDTANKMAEDWKNAKSVYDFTVKNIKGEDVSLEKYKGFVLIIVNVASKCGYTSKHYKELVELDEKYREKGLRILGFPCNQFGGQEPGDADNICSFAEKQNVKFDIFEKLNVNGDDAHPLFKYLKSKQGGLLVNSIKWNFTKFIVDKNGQPVERHAANVSPLGMEKSLEKYL